MIDEQRRLEEVQRYDVLDTGREAAFDELCELTAMACRAPMAFISIVDSARVWHKASYGYLPGETPRAGSFCSDTLSARRLFMVGDAPADPRYANYPAVTGPVQVRFYAGAPLISPRGLPIGSLCVLDSQPRSLSPEGQRALLLLRDAVMRLFEDRRELIDLRSSESLREEAVEALLATKTDLERRIELRTRDAEAAHERIRSILGRVQDGFVALDREWRYSYVNERAAQLFNRRPEDLIGKHIWSEFPEGIGQPFHLAYERAMREQVPITFSDYYQPWDRWFENRVYPSAEGLTIFFTETTDRMRAERALQETARGLAEAQAVAHVGSWQWSVVEDRVTWSAEMHRIYGTSPEHFDGSYRGFLSRVHPEDLEHTQAVISDAYQHPRRFEYEHRIVRPDGAVRMLYTAGDAITDDAGRLTRMVGSCWDITDQWEAKRRLEHTSAVVQTVLDSLAGGVLIVGEDGRILARNDTFVQLFALPAAPSALAAPLFAELASRLADGSLLAGLTASAAADSHAVLEGRLQTRDGVALVCASRPCQSAGRLTGRIWTFERAPLP